MIKGGVAAFKGKNVLLLQGPVGPFFSRLRRDLEAAGARVHKANFNGGDWLFYPRGAKKFRGHRRDFPVFFNDLIDHNHIDTVLLFGDCRPLHQIAYDIANRRGLDIGVFEEGYVRPDYVTLERHGVNGHSRIPRIVDFYRTRKPVSVPKTVEVGNTFWYAVRWAMLYYTASVVLRPFFPRYNHHRPLSFKEGWPWLKSAWRKQKFKLLESGVQEELTTNHSGHYYLATLQVHNDAQVKVHSDFASVQQFIKETIASFAIWAPKDTLLVIKHHPMDRGYHDHTRLIGDQVQLYGVKDRVRYIHDQHLPTLLDHARGVVLINSTVGLSALVHGKPLKVCGVAIYDLMGITYQGDLDRFWNDASNFEMDRDLFEKYRAYLIEHTQVNGSFFKRTIQDGSKGAGLVWEKPQNETIPNFDITKEIGETQQKTG